MEFSSEYIQQSDSVDFYVCVYWYLVVHVAICIIYMRLLFTENEYIYHFAHCD